MPGARRPAVPGASARELAGPFPPSVLQAGPPPAPALDPPWSASPVQPGGAALGHVVSWMARPHVARWWCQDWPAGDWADEVRRQLAGDHSRPSLVALDGEPVAYVEVYRVARDVVGPHLTRVAPGVDAPVAAHDLGVHLAIGDAAGTGRGLGRSLLGALAAGLLAADPRCSRIVGDPAADHHGARRAFAAAGFGLVAEVDLAHKRAALMVRSR